MTPNLTTDHISYPDAPEWGQVGSSFAGLLLSWRSWIHRRVDVIEIEDASVARRSISIDFTQPQVPAPMRWAPGGPPVHYVPLTRLRKRTLTNFDLTDESGRSLPLLTRSQHKELATYALLASAADALPSLPTTLHTLCRNVATTGPDQSVDHLRALVQAVPLPPDHYFFSLARVFTESFVVTVPMSAEPGARRIVKFSYDELVGDPYLGFWEAAERGAAWRSKPLWFPAFGLGDVPSYHLEVEAPPGLKITRRSLVASDSPEPTKKRYGPFRRARFYHQPEAGAIGIAAVHFRPMTSTVIRSAAALALLTVLLIGAFGAAMLAGGFQKSVGAAPSLLLFGPGLLSLVLVRSGEHPMTVDMLFLIRLMTLIPGGAAFVGAVLLSAVNHSTDAVLVVWAVLLAVAGMAATVLCVGWRACAGPSDPDRAGARAAHVF